MTTLIEVTNLDFTYPDGTPALFDINLTVREQEFIALIGQNGSGKTTFSKCLERTIQANQRHSQHRGN